MANLFSLVKVVIYNCHLIIAGIYNLFNLFL